jgi:hypothetical protein
LHKSLAVLTSREVLVGIAATDAMERKRQVFDLAGRLSGKKRKRAEKIAVEGSVNNAELMYIHTNGSPLKHIPARPVIEAAIQDKTNNNHIVHELKLAAEAALIGDEDTVTRELELAGVVAENASKGWFTNARNGWAPNAPSTIRAKGSSRPLIDTGALRQAISHQVVEK